MSVARTDAARSVIVGRVLREVREDAGLSVARACVGQPFGPSRLSAYERGDRTVSLDQLLALARMYHVAPGVLMSVIEARMQDVGRSGYAAPRDVGGPGGVADQDAPGPCPTPVGGC